MSGGGPVARLLAPVINRVAVLVVVLAGIAVSGVVLSTQSLDYLTEELQPAAAANKDVRQDLSDMQAAVHAWAADGRRSALDDYRQAQARLPGHQQLVRQFASDDTELGLLVARQTDAAQAWIDRYGDPRADGVGGQGTFDRSLFRAGVQRFAAFRDAHQQTVAAFDARVRDARDATALWLRATILAVVLATAVGALVIARARRRLLAELADPLQDLELVVQRMADQDRQARAATDGPREVRAVAVALNDLADGQARARAVEHRIQHELRTLDTAKDDFVSNVSHELRTPLTTISGYLELVAEEFADRMAPRHAKMLEATRRNVSRLRLLIDDLLTLSNAESRTTAMEQIDVASVIRDVVTDVRMTGTRRGIRIDLQVPDESTLVLGDRAMLHRAFLNLLTNAVKFSHDGGVVDVTVAREGDRLSVVVRDRGIGIPAGEIDRLGGRFFRASNAVTNEIAGTGLGVRIVQTIIDRHAGEIVIDSDEGAGTTVSVRLHLQAESAVTPAR